MLPSYWEVVWATPLSTPWDTGRCPQLARTLWRPGTSEAAGARSCVGAVLCVGYRLPPSPRGMEIFLFSKSGFQCIGISFQ